MDAALDVNRAVYLQTVTDTTSLLAQYQEQCTFRWDSLLDPFELKIGNNAARGYYLIVSNKNKSKLSALC